MTIVIRAALKGGTVNCKTISLDLFWWVGRGVGGGWVGGEGGSNKTN